MSTHAHNDGKPFDILAHLQDEHGLDVTYDEAEAVHDEEHS